MKIRTGFVTNSSSYASACVSIQSRELIELLKEYEDVVGPSGSFIGSIEKDTFTDYWDEGETGSWEENVPKTLNEVLDKFIDGLREQSDYRDPPEKKERLQSLIKVLEDQKQELTASIQKVEWWHNNESFDEFEPDGAREKSFIYNRRDRKSTRLNSSHRN